MAAKVSPDSFIQQALQLAWYRDQGYVTATYESASTRGFLHGRTETIRSVTSDSRAFVGAMLDPKTEVSLLGLYSGKVKKAGRKTIRPPTQGLFNP
jgi:hypothetical protein